MQRCQARAWERELSTDAQIEKLPRAELSWLRETPGRRPAPGFFLPADLERHLPILGFDDKQDVITNMDHVANRDFQLNLHAKPPWWRSCHFHRVRNISVDFKGSNDFSPLTNVHVAGRRSSCAGNLSAHPSALRDSFKAASNC